MAADKKTGSLKSSIVATRLTADEIDALNRMCDQSDRSSSWILRFAFNRLRMDPAWLDKYGKIE